MDARLVHASTMRMHARPCNACTYIRLAQMVQVAFAGKCDYACRARQHTCMHARHEQCAWDTSRAHAWDTSGARVTQCAMRMGRVAGTRMGPVPAHACMYAMSNAHGTHRGRANGTDRGRTNGTDRWHMRACMPIAMSTWRCSTPAITIHKYACTSGAHVESYGGHMCMHMHVTSTCAHAWHAYILACMSRHVSACTPSAARKCL